MERLDRLREVALSEDEATFLLGRAGPVLVSRHVLVGELRRDAARREDGKLSTMVHAPQRPSNLVLKPVTRERWLAIRPQDANVGNRWLTVGREETSDVVINDYTVSIQHARLSVIPQLGRVILQDVGSTNGTAHNGVLVEPGQQIMLVAGDSVCFGRMELAYFTARAFYRYLVGTWEWAAPAEAI